MRRLSIVLTTAVVLAATLVLTACGGDDTRNVSTTVSLDTTALSTASGQEPAEIEPISMEREPGPPALQTANEATALALRYYIYARLKTEEFSATDVQSVDGAQMEQWADELVSIWETADALASGAGDLADTAVTLLETSSVDPAATVQPQAQFAMLVATDSHASAMYLAENGAEVIDRQTWAENLTKQYDALRGAQRYQQLAQQLGTDTKTAVEQMALAQKVIQNAAALDEAQAEVGAYTRSINIVEGYKTASKVGLFVGATVATGGGTLTALAGSSMTVAQAGAVIVGGVDCIVDVGKTTSSIILGEDHQVTVDLEKAGDVLQPVSMVMGLAAMDPSSAVEEIAFLGEAMMEWCYPGKVTGIAVETTKAGSSLVLARIMELMSSNIPDVKRTLEGLKLHFPSEEGVALSELILVNTVERETALERMRELGAQLPAPPGQEDETLTGEQPPETATGPSAGRGIAGTYSGSAALEYTAEGVESEASLAITLHLGEAGTGTANVYGFDGEAQYAGNSVTFSVKMKQDGATVTCSGKGKVSRSDSGIEISGDMSVTFAGMTVASYVWTVQR